MSVIELTKALIACPSVTPNEAGCHAILTDYLVKLGFNIENMRFGDVDNIWARKGNAGPLVVFAGHTDVVPSGPEQEWLSPPFQPTERDGFLFGRGAVDMKGGLAAMVVGVEQYLKANPEHAGSIAFLITSDEEGASTHGTKKVIEALVARSELTDYCIVGEPASENQLGDQIRIGRRGSLHGKLTIFGKQGHIAYPVPGENPIHQCLAALQALTGTVWDHGDDRFPPTSFQISNIHAGTGALNVTPGHIEIHFNFRFSPAVTPVHLKEQVTKILEVQNLQFDLAWNLSSEPFITKKGKLIEAAQKSIQEVTGLEPILSTGGGTSDGRFVAATGAEVIELGLRHETAHQLNEYVTISDLKKLPDIYEAILKKLIN